jgi:hypothetical protein
MPSNVELLKWGYQGIVTCEATEALEAYAEFHSLATQLGPQMETSAIQDTESCPDDNLYGLTHDVLERSRSSRNGVRGTASYFRGSGMIVVANNKHIITADYEASNLEDGDPEDPLREAYQYRALDRAGLALAVARSGIVRSSVAGMEHTTVLRALAGVGVDDDPGLGYAFKRHRQYGTVVVGAAGVMPSISTLAYFSSRYADIVERDQKTQPNLELNTAFAGIYNTAMAEMVAMGITSARNPIDNYLDHHSVPLSPVDFVAKAVDLHRQ